LVVVNYYPFIESNIKLGKQDSTNYMYYAALSTHPNIPSSIIENLIRVIAFNFVSEGNRSEYIATGLNAIKAIAERHPESMTKDMLQSLVCLRSIKEK
ncbi:MAG: Protein SDA1, partial [Paramarteilia canceri]